MRHIKTVIVTYDDGTKEAFAGRGVSNVVNSTAPADKTTGTPARDYRFLSLTLSLPLTEDPPGE